MSPFIRDENAAFFVRARPREIVELEMSFPALDAVMMRARLATVFRIRHATVAANRLAVKGFASG